MKFTVSSADLLAAVNIVNGAIPSKSTMPILESLLLERDGDTLRISATDLEISIIHPLAVNFAGDSSDAPIAVPAKRLLDTLRALPEVPLSFSSDDDFSIHLSTDQGRYKMVGQDGKDFPALPSLEEKQEITVEGNLIERAVRKTNFAVSKDALRPAMMGVFFQIGNTASFVVATDGHRLVKLVLEEMTSTDAAEFIVPEKALTLVGRVAGEESCSLHLAEGHVSFEFEDTQVLARLIDESYPNYEAVIPKENDRRLRVNRQAMLNAVKRVGLYSSSMTNQVRLELAAEEIKISAEDIERASEAHETIPCEYDGESMTIGFNADYLTEVLNNLASDEVLIDMSSPNRAGIMTPDEQEEGENILMLIMPVMLNQYA